MHIESGTTTEHRVRLGLFLVMVTFFAAYFGYDGMWGYPAQNLNSARDTIKIKNPSLTAEQIDAVRINPDVLVASLDELKQQTTSGSAPTLEEVEQKLGQPALKLDAAGDAMDAWYVGPAAWARLRFEGGKLRLVDSQQSVDKSEGDIWLQKILGVILGVIALGTAIYYIRIMTMKTVLDDRGLCVKGRWVAWDEITELDTSAYAGKGWLDVIYRRDNDISSVRLDSYHIAKFNEIINTMCERKGLPSPIKQEQLEAVDEEG